MKNTQENNNDKAKYERQSKWFELMKLGYSCPAAVPMVMDLNGHAPKVREDGKPPMMKIKGAARATLQAFIYHCDGNTDSTFVRLETIVKDVAADAKTVDQAVASLKQAGILIASHRFDHQHKYTTNIWKINRERLKDLAGDKPEEEFLEQVIASVKNHRRCTLATPIARLPETKSHLYKIAKESQIRIDIEMIREGTDTAEVEISLFKGS